MGKPYHQSDLNLQGLQGILSTRFMCSLGAPRKREVLFPEVLPSSSPVYKRLVVISRHSHDLRSFLSSPPSGLNISILGSMLNTK